MCSVSAHKVFVHERERVCVCMDLVWVCLPVRVCVPGCVHVCVSMC